MNRDRFPRRSGRRPARPNNCHVAERSAKAADRRAVTDPKCGVTPQIKTGSSPLAAPAALEGCHV